jgi:O-antigen/teichoic acid export membrane protein
MNLNYPAIFDSNIRIVTIIVRGLFIFAAAKYLTNEDFGMYVVIGAVVALMQYLVAGDFSYIAHREFFSSRIRFDEMVRTQAVQMATSYIIAIPITLALLPNAVEQTASIMTLMILLFEAMSSEIQRHLVAISRFTRANIILFVKSAAWMVPIYLLLADESNRVNLDCILYAWVIGSMLSVLFGLISIKDYIFLKSRINKTLIQLYIKKVMIILAGTLAARSIFSLDRIIVEKFIGVEQAGVYGLYVGIALGFVAIVDSGNLTRSYPKLVANVSENSGKFRDVSMRTQTITLILTLLAIIAYYLLVNRFLLYISKESHIEYTKIGALLILAYGLYSLSFPLNCWIYAKERDKIITIINIISLMPLIICFILNSISMSGVAFLVLVCACLHYALRKLYIMFAEELAT